MGDSTSESSLVFVGVAPHPPIMVQEVGGDATAKVRASIEAMATLTRRVIDVGAETILLISPHAPLEVDSFVAYRGPQLNVTFENFGAPEVSFDVPIDDDLLSQLVNTGSEADYTVKLLSSHDADHGSAVPLYFLLRNGWRGRIAALGYCFLSNYDHLRFGEVIRRSVDRLGRRVAFIASGDLSHRLKPQAPAGFNPKAHLFDKEVVEALEANAPERIVEIEPSLRNLAGECGYRSMLTAIGASKMSPLSCEVLSYEAPFGVGYMVAQLVNQASRTEENQTLTHQVGEDDSDAAEITSIARNAVEAFVRGAKVEHRVPAVGLLAERAPCFVSLKTRDRELRGCIGTIEATKDTLAEEVVANAVSAASHDPRFPPVTESELAGLRYSVDVLLPPEPAVMEDLDPRIYGVIVEDKNRSRRGLLLPDIPGVDSAEQQVEIAARKAGIPSKTPLRISRFRVQRFREADPTKNRER